MTDYIDPYFIHVDKNQRQKTTQSGGKLLRTYAQQEFMKAKPSMSNRCNTLLEPSTNTQAIMQLVPAGL